MATDLHRQRAEIATLINDWEYYSLEVKIYLVVKAVTRRMRKNVFLRPFAVGLMTLYSCGNIVTDRVGEWLTSMKLWKRLVIIAVCLLLSASIVLVASQSWELAMVLGIAIALPLGIWIGKQL